MRQTLRSRMTTSLIHLLCKKRNADTTTFRFTSILRHPDFSKANRTVNGFVDVFACEGKKVEECLLVHEQNEALLRGNPSWLIKIDNAVACVHIVNGRVFHEDIVVVLSDHSTRLQ